MWHLYLNTVDDYRIFSFIPEYIKEQRQTTGINWKIADWECVCRKTGRLKRGIFWHNMMSNYKVQKEIDFILQAIVFY